MGKTIFDPKFVHFMWDDELKGKAGIFAGSINELKDRVENKGKGYRLTCKGVGDDNYPFKSSDMLETCWPFFYYDPLYVYKAAWKDGLTIQYMTTINVKNGWTDITEDWAWDINRDTQYRIKPEKDLRPFKDIQELKNAWSCKAEMSVDYEESLIWVRWKGGKEHKLITGYYNEGSQVFLCGDWVSLEQLFERYEFIDGTPCGVEFDL